MTRYAIAGKDKIGNTVVAVLTLTTIEREKLGSQLPKFLAINLVEAQRQMEAKVGKVTWTQSVVVNDMPDPLPTP